MKSDLRKSIQIAACWLVGLYVLVLVVVVVLTCYANRAHQSRLAHAITLSVRNSIVLRDLRQVVSILNASASRSFTSVEYVTEKGDVIFRLPNGERPDSAATSIFDSTLYIPLHTSTAHGDSEDQLGELRFTHSMLSPILFSLGLWLLFLLLALPIFSQIKSFIEKRHQEILIIRKSEWLGHMAQQVSHDIRSPLSALNAVAAKCEKELPERERTIMERAIARLDGITSQLLIDSRRENPEQSGASRNTRPSADAPEMDRSSLVSVLNEIISEKQVQLSDRQNIELRTDLCDTQEKSLPIPATELGRILSNLIDNAVEAVKDKGLITVAVRIYGGRMSLIVSDNGCGIPSEILAHVGRRGFSYGKSNEVNGNGLGVFHAKHTVEAAGGHFQIQSREGKGTIVTMTLPTQH